MISDDTYDWMARHLTAEDLDQWGDTTIRALAVLFDGLTQPRKDIP